MKKDTPHERLTIISWHSILTVCSRGSRWTLWSITSRYTIYTYAYTKKYCDDFKSCLQTKRLSVSCITGPTFLVDWQIRAMGKSSVKLHTLHLQIHSRCRVVFLSSFISALFLYSFRSIPTWHDEVLYTVETFFSLVSVLSWVFPNQPPNRRRTCLLCWRRTLLALETNALKTNALKTRVWTSAELVSRWLLLTCKYYEIVRFQALILTSEHATPTSYTHAIAFSAGLNSLHVD